jgi:predicted  nucleic acid-binding Zn-ribbon protein
MMDKVSDIVGNLLDLTKRLDTIEQTNKRFIDTFKNFRETFTTGANALSGVSLEKKVDEYSDLYTQVLLGVHLELEAQKSKIQDCTAQVTELAHQIEGLKRQVVSMRIPILVASAAFIVALVSVGVALWSTLS